MDLKFVSSMKLNLFVAAGIFGLAAAPAYAGEGFAMAGKVVSVDGKVLIRQDDSAGGTAVALKPGAQVRQGDVINTSSDGKVKLLLEDKTILILGPRRYLKSRNLIQNTAAIAMWIFRCPMGRSVLR